MVLIEAEASVPSEVSRAARVLKLKLGGLRRVIFVVDPKSNILPTDDRGDLELRRDPETCRFGECE